MGEVVLALFVLYGVPFLIGTYILIQALLHSGDAGPRSDSYSLPDNDREWEKEQDRQHWAKKQEEFDAYWNEKYEKREDERIAKWHRINNGSGETWR